MLESLKKLFFSFINFILPPRSDFAIVQKLDQKIISSLPEGPKVVDLDWIHPLFYYKDNRVRAIIWELKYKENARVLEYIGQILYEEILEVISDIVLFDGNTEFILLPIPITNERRTERGYNQSEYIAKAILENDISHTLLYAPQWFQKVKETPRQSHSQSKEDRVSNLLGSFEASHKVEGKCVILIDDVVTTGSTLSEARKTLLEAGAKNVLAFTIAH